MNLPEWIDSSTGSQRELKLSVVNAVTLGELVKTYNPYFTGWFNCFGRFCPSKCSQCGHTKCGENSDFLKHFVPCMDRENSGGGSVCERDYKCTG